VFLSFAQDVKEGWLGGNDQRRRPWALSIEYHTALWGVKVVERWLWMATSGLFKRALRLPCRIRPLAAGCPPESDQGPPRESIRRLHRSIRTVSTACVWHAARVEHFGVARRDRNRCAFLAGENRTVVLLHDSCPPAAKGGFSF